MVPNTSETKALKDVYLMRPDGAYVVEAESEIEEAEELWVHRVQGKANALFMPSETAFLVSTAFAICYSQNRKKS